MADTSSISSKLRNKSFDENIRCSELEYQNKVKEDNFCADSTRKQIRRPGLELKFSMITNDLLNPVIEELISALDRLGNKEQKLPLKIMRETK
jgi:hypothetical protein